LTSDGRARTDLDPVQLRSAAVPHSRAGEITILHVWMSADASVGVVDRTAADHGEGRGQLGQPVDVDGERVGRVGDQVLRLPSRLHFGRVSRTMASRPVAGGVA
jgi:hypothetical protein